MEILFRSAKREMSRKLETYTRVTASTYYREHLIKLDLILFLFNVSFLSLAISLNFTREPIRLGQVFPTELCRKNSRIEASAEIKNGRPTVVVRRLSTPN